MTSIEATRTTHTIEADNISVKKAKSLNNVEREKPELLRGLSDEELKVLEKKLLRKVDYRLLPTLGIIYVMNYLDRWANPLTSEVCRLRVIQKCHRRGPPRGARGRSWVGTERVSGKLGEACSSRTATNSTKPLDLRVHSLRRIHPHAGPVQHVPQQDWTAGCIPGRVHEHLGRSGAVTRGRPLRMCSLTTMAL